MENEDLELTVGLEIHAELNTASKMFCACKNNPDEETPNKNICPICMAHPGTLPVINKEAVRQVLRMGKAVGGTLAKETEFHRKNYFYPDIPKGYQISQYDSPLVSGGELVGVLITRIHLEEDTARSQHEGDRSLVDFNRAGVPLMELVTEPVIHSAEQAGRFARELQLLLRTLGAGEANMEKGEMRVEANISVGTPGKLGQKVEVKNLNSFRVVEKAIAYELSRQKEALARGEKIVQETRGWDDAKQITFSQRIKESSHDYRYVPDKDLPPLHINLADWALDLPELPDVRRARYTALGIKAEDADLFTRSFVLGSFFDLITASEFAHASLAANYLASDLAGKLQAGELPEEWFTKESNALRIRDLMTMLAENKLSSRGAKEILILLASSDAPVAELAEAHGLLQQSDTGALELIVDAIIAANPGVVAEYKGGKAASMQFLIGQGMKESKGSANPQMLRELFDKKLA